jgi:hypothetical protein
MKNLSLFQLVARESHLVSASVRKEECGARRRSLGRLRLVPRHCRPSFTEARKFRCRRTRQNWRFVALHVDWRWCHGSRSWLLNRPSHGGCARFNLATVSNCNVFHWFNWPMCCHPNGSWSDGSRAESIVRRLQDSLDTTASAGRSDGIVAGYVDCWHQDCHLCQLPPAAVIVFLVTPRHSITVSDTNFLKNWMIVPSNSDAHESVEPRTPTVYMGSSEGTKSEERGRKSGLNK